MSVHKRPGSPYWQYNFARGGIRYRGSTKELVKRQAQQFERDLKSRIERGEIQTIQKATLGNLFVRYWQDHAQHIRSARTVLYHIDALQARLDTHQLLAMFSNDDVAKYVAMRRTQVAPATVNREIATLRAAHRMAAESWEWQARAIAWRRHHLTEARERVRWIAREQARDLVGHLPEHLALAAEWSLLTGCRKSETFGLKWQDINFNRRVARVLGKGQKWRSVELSPASLDLLANIARIDDRPVFSSINLRKHWARACTLAKLDDFRWHDLRHTFATWLRQEGVPIEIVQQALGHADISTTMRYAHIARHELQEAMQKLTLGTANNHKTRHNIGMTKPTN